MLEIVESWLLQEKKKLIQNVKKKAPHRHFNKSKKNPHNVKTAQIGLHLLHGNDKRKRCANPARLVLILDS